MTEVWGAAGPVNTAEQVEHEEPLYVFIDAFCLSQHANEASDLHSAMAYANASVNMESIVKKQSSER